MFLKVVVKRVQIRYCVGMVAFFLGRNGDGVMVVVDSLGTVVVMLDVRVMRAAMLRLMFFMSEAVMFGFHGMLLLMVDALRQVLTFRRSVKFFEV